MNEFIIAALFSILGNIEDDNENPNTAAIDIKAQIRQAQAGDPDAVATLYQIFVDQIYRYVRYRVPTNADAEDITAEVFVKMVEGLPNYKITEAPFESWLYRIAAARVADFHRARSRRPQDELPDNLQSSGPLPEEQILSVQEFDELRDALQQLSDSDQTILIMRFVERKSHDEVAEILGKSVTAVKSAQHRALTRLAGVLGITEKSRHYLRGKNG